jgi:hypothetical protein
MPRPLYLREKKPLPYPWSRSGRGDKEKKPSRWRKSNPDRPARGVVTIVTKPKFFDGPYQTLNYSSATAV